ncbi:MAG: B12-binding domain-containing radical SAM protein [Candidatus Bathyarchaeota archaeon]|nr:B12-binding domain-containing radical SAM protein [Candidatus Bathyarchaeota archaeon]
MKTRITLINPPYPAGAHSHPAFMPLGIGYLGAVLTKNHYEVKVIDCQAQHVNYEQLKETLTKTHSDIIGVTCTTLTYKSALKILKTAKEVYPNCVTAMGGPHITFWDNQGLQEAPYLDIAIRNEGELTIVELADRIEKGQAYTDIVGTTCRKDGKIVRNPDRPPLENLDSLPFPALHLWEKLGEIRKYGTIPYPILGSRGCTFWCNFCTTVRMFGRRYRMRSPKNVVDEIEYLHKNYHANQFTFYDDAFTVDQNRTMEICNEIHRRGLKIKWDCETRVDMVSRELLFKMREAGCIAVWYGVESGSKKLLTSMGKGFNLNQTRRAFKWAKEAGLMTVAGVILGFPGETKESVWETIRFVKELNPNDVGFYIATPYPGTPLYDEVKANGTLRVFDFDKYDTATPTFEIPNMTMAELSQIREQAFQSFYLSPAYFISALGMFKKGKMWGLGATRLILAHFRRAIIMKVTNPSK